MKIKILVILFFVFNAFVVLQKFDFFGDGTTVSEMEQTSPEIMMISQDDYLQELMLSDDSSGVIVSDEQVVGVDNYIVNEVPSMDLYTKKGERLTLAFGNDLVVIVDVKNESFYPSELYNAQELKNLIPGSKISVVKRNNKLVSIIAQLE